MCDLHSPAAAPNLYVWRVGGTERGKVDALNAACSSCSECPLGVRSDLFFLLREQCLELSGVATRLFSRHCG